MQKISYAGFLFILGLFLVPQLSLAATTARLGENAFLYTITYKFGYEKYETRLPIAAVRQSVADDSSVVGYEILNNKLRTSVGTTKAVVLSNAKVEGNEYVIPKGETAEFTLVAFLIVPEEKVASTSHYALKVSSLPFTLSAPGLELGGRLNKSELRTFVTGGIKK